MKHLTRFLFAVGMAAMLVTVTSVVGCKKQDSNSILKVEIWNGFLADTIAVGDKVLLQCSVHHYGDEFETTKAWKSSDGNVATVSAEGAVTGVGGGSAYIIVIVNGQYADSCRVTVLGSGGNNPADYPGSELSE